MWFSCDKVLLSNNFTFSLLRNCRKSVCVVRGGGGVVKVQINLGERIVVEGKEITNPPPVSRRGNLVQSALS